MSFMSSAIAATVAPQPPLEVLRLGRVPYGEALDFQKDRVEARLTERAPNTCCCWSTSPW